MPPKLRRKKTLKKTVRKNRRTRRKLAKTIKKQLRENRTAVVVVGRFQPPHKGHINMIKGGIELLMGESSISTRTRSSGKTKGKKDGYILVMGNPQAWRQRDNTIGTNYKNNPLEIYKKMTYIKLMLGRDNKMRFITPYRISNDWMSNSAIAGNNDLSDEDKKEYSLIFDEIRENYISGRKNKMLNGLRKNVDYAIDMLKDDYKHIIIGVGDEDYRKHSKSILKRTKTLKNTIVKVVSLGSSRSMGDDRVSGTVMRELSDKIYEGDKINEFALNTFLENTREGDMTMRDSLNMVNSLRNSRGSSVDGIPLNVVEQTVRDEKIRQYLPGLDDEKRTIKRKNKTVRRLRDENVDVEDEITLGGNRKCRTRKRNKLN